MKQRAPCGQCGGPHLFDTSVPSPLWNRVIRGAGLPDYLCTTCIVAAFVRAGESFSAELYGDPVNLPDKRVPVIEVRVGERQMEDSYGDQQAAIRGLREANTGLVAALAKAQGVCADTVTTINHRAWRFDEMLPPRMQDLRQRVLTALSDVATADLPTCAAVVMQQIEALLAEVAVCTTTGSNAVSDKYCAFCRAVVHNDQLPRQHLHTCIITRARTTLVKLRTLTDGMP